MRGAKLSLGAIAVMAFLTWAAIEFVPETLFFPVVEYTMPGGIHFATLKDGELDRLSCEATLKKMSGALHAQCPQCQSV